MPENELQKPLNDSTVSIVLINFIEHLDNQNSNKCSNLADILHVALGAFLLGEDCLKMFSKLCVSFERDIKMSEIIEAEIKRRISIN